MLFKRPQADGCEESSTGCELLERMVGQIETKQLLLQLELLGWAVIRHRSGLGSETEIRGTVLIVRSCHQVEQVALATVTVLGPRRGPVKEKIEISHQLGPVGGWVHGIQGTAVNQRFQSAAVEHRGRDPITKIRKRTERAVAIP